MRRESPRWQDISQANPGPRLTGGGGGICSLSLAGIILLSAAVGCSKKTEKSAPIDWAERGQSQERPLWDAPEEAPRREPADQKRSKPTPPIASSDSRASDSPAGSASGGRAGQSMADSQAAGRSGGGQSSAAGGKGPGSVAGSRGGGQSGASFDGGDAEPAPAPALPGRGERRPAMSAERAAGFAKANLDRARTAMRVGDVENASQLALEAYDAVAPHAAVSPKCGSLCAEAGKFLENVSRKQGRAADQPTRFE